MISFPVTDSTRTAKPGAPHRAVYRRLKRLPLCSPTLIAGAVSQPEPVQTHRVGFLLREFTTFLVYHTRLTSSNYFLRKVIVVGLILVFRVILEYNDEDMRLAWLVGSRLVPRARPLTFILADVKAREKT